MQTISRLVPLLVVRGARDAIDFYVRALGARVLACYEHGPERHVSHADLSLDDLAFSVTEAVPAFDSHAPPALGGSPVVLQLLVSDVDSVLAALCAAGASVVFPLQDLLGERMARVRDPFGHVWILHQRLEQRSTEALQRERDALFAHFTELARRAGPAAPVESQASLGETPAGAQVRPHGDPAPPNRADPGARRGRIHVVLGPVGAGKSTFARGLARERRALRLTLDAWLVELFGPDRPAADVMEWYLERRARCAERIWDVARAAASVGGDVVLELGLVRRGEREALYERIVAAGLRFTLHLVDAPRDERRRRVEERNRSRGPTFSMPVPPDVFELASDAWEPLDAGECEGRDVHVVSTPS